MKTAVLLLAIAFTEIPVQPIVFLDFAETGIEMWHTDKEKCFAAGEDLRNLISGKKWMQELPDTPVRMACVKMPLPEFGQGV